MIKLVLKFTFSCLLQVFLISTLLAQGSGWTDVTTGPLGDMGYNTGVAWGDYDDDGLPDLYLAKLNGGANKLLRNIDGVNFEEVNIPILQDTGEGDGVAWADFDNDGDLDLYLANNGPNRLFRNLGNDNFERVQMSILEGNANTFGAVWADFDNDGFVDLYLANRDADNVLIRNVNGSSFEEAGQGVVDLSADSRGAAWADYDNDGDQDLYVVIHRGANRLFRNTGGGFVDANISAVEDAGDGRSAAWGDYNNDGYFDLYLVNEGANRLYRNINGNDFVDAGIALVENTNRGRSAAWGDFNNDGFLDIYLSNNDAANALYMNSGGNDFVDASVPPIDIDWPSSGMALADYDLDGDLDIYLSNIDMPVVSSSANKLFQNNLNTGNHWLVFELLGSAGSNDAAIGARVSVTAGGTTQIRQVEGGSGFLSQNSLELEFGLGNTTSVDSVVVNWPSGIRQVLTQSDLIVDDYNTIIEQEPVPDIAVNPLNHDFGSVNVGSSAEMTFTVTNEGEAALNVFSTTLSGADASEFQIESGGGSFALAPGLQRNIVVSFNPSSEGTKNASLELSTDDPDEDPTITLTGTGVMLEPDITVNPLNHNFGSITVDASTQMTFTVTNQGDGALTVSSTTLTGTNAGEFQIVSGGGPFVLDASLQRDIVVRFSPTSEGSKTATLEIASDDPDEPQVDVNLSGTGVTANVASILVVPASHDFGQVTVSTTSQRTFFIVNNGTADLNVMSTTLTGTNASEFNIESGGGAATIEPDSSHELVVSFNPSTTGAKSATLEISSNDPDDNPFNVALSGEGVAQDVPNIVANPTSYDYGTVQVGSSGQNSFFITNTGSADLNVSGATLIGANAGEFAIDSGGGSFMLTPTSSREIVVVFAPTSAGGKSATLRIASDDPDQSQTDINLTGTGEGGADTIDPTLGAPMVSQPVMLDTEVTVSIDVTDNVGVQSVQLFFRQGGANAFTNQPMTLQSGSTYAAVIDHSAVTTRGLEYRIEAMDVNNNTAETALAGIRVRVPDQGLTRSILRSGSEQNAYQLFSIPIELTNAAANFNLADDLGTYDDTVWRFFELRPNQTYAELSNTTINIEPGQAYWLIVRDSGQMIDTGVGTSVNTSRDFLLPLNAGWTFVSTPFNFPIPLSNVRLGNGGQLDIRTFNGSEFVAYTGALQPFEGYAVGTGTATNLIIDPQLFAVSSTTPAEQTTLSDRTEWNVQITARVDDARDTQTVAAVHTLASHGLDKYDSPEAPVIGKYVSVYFPHSDWGQAFTMYTRDVRPIPTDGESWEIEVKTNIDEAIQITLSGLHTVPPDFEAWLVDPELGIVQNLRESNTFSFVGPREAHPKRLRLVVGTPAFFSGETESLEPVPAAFQLDQNFPNPFNPTTTIRYGLPAADNVTLKIYNLLGETVATLLDAESQEAGFHTVVWNGKDRFGKPVPSGVYIYQIQSSGNKTLTKKMALLK